MTLQEEFSSPLTRELVDLLYMVLAPKVDNLTGLMGMSAKGVFNGLKPMLPHFFSEFDQDPDQQEIFWTELLSRVERIKPEMEAWLDERRGMVVDGELGVGQSPPSQQPPPSHPPINNPSDGEVDLQSGDLIMDQDQGYSDGQTQTYDCDYYQEYHQDHYDD